ncbi:bile acid:sodium symporter [Pontibacter qinzhouensis]|uniref:Bile acid:sodium symporter n=1 Tax=Pontibacter qinzhouensis TaxID=2603253 RepID=A0A5C8KAA4_9BACT|nr:bile acid:sodium symporter family protein [Pontibacter qinzhouensis]TXK48611.1 bile acid:sodium symporter [Pontibacter qinzhouensis]
MQKEKAEHEAQKAVGLVPRVGALAARVGLDWFLLALLAMIGLAYLWPEFGIDREPVSLGDVAGYGVSLIFFFYGLRLSLEKLKAGLSSWRLHMVVQLSTFLLFPLLVLPLHSFFEGTEYELLWLGSFYVAALPSTVSSAVVMVAIAGGNMPAAIFNASISSILGIFITPLWMGLFLSASNTADFEMGDVLGKLVLQVLVPVILGILLNSRWGSFAEKHKKKLRYFDQIIILTIVYTSFCESFERDMFSAFGWQDILLLSIAMLLLFFLAFLLINLLSRLFGFKREDRITAIFCGSKKSLVHGTVMSKVLFPDANMVGIILLPIMVYHALQLLVSSMMAQRMGRAEVRELESGS